MIICQGQSPFKACTPPTIFKTVWLLTNGLWPQLFALIEYISFVLLFCIDDVVVLVVVDDGVVVDVVVLVVNNVAVVVDKVESYKQKY